MFWPSSNFSMFLPLLLLNLFPGHHGKVALISSSHAHAMSKPLLLPAAIETYKNSGENADSKLKMEEQAVGYQEPVARQLLHLAGCAYAINDRDVIDLPANIKLGKAKEKMADCARGGKSNANAMPETESNEAEESNWETGPQWVGVQQCDGSNYCVWYLAWCRSSRRIVVVFRGTDTYFQLLEEIKITLTKEMPALDDGLGLVNPYFLRALTNRVWKRNGQDFSYPDSIWQLMVARIDMIVEKYFENSPAVTVQFTGHSLGGALAALAAAKLAAFLRKDTEMLKKDTERFRQSQDAKIEQQIDSFRRLKEHGKLDLEVYTFGEPRLGNKQFAVEFEKLVPKNFRIVNGSDLVPHLPACEWDGAHCSETPKNAKSYFHHGTEIWYEHGMDEKEMKGKRNLHKMICRSESADCCNQLLKNSSIFAWLFKKELKYVRQTITNHLHYFDNYVMIIECFMYNSNELIEYFSQVSEIIHKHLSSVKKAAADVKNGRLSSNSSAGHSPYKHRIIKGLDARDWQLKKPIIAGKPAEEKKESANLENVIELPKQEVKTESLKNDGRLSWLQYLSAY